MNTIEQKEKENLENYQHSPFNWCPSNVKTFQNSLLWKIELPQKLQRCQGVIKKLAKVSFRMSEENTSGCQGKSRKQLREVEDAQLAAHRLVEST